MYTNMNRRFVLIFCLPIYWLVFILPTPITGNALSISTPTLTKYVQSPSTYSDPNFGFLVKNNEATIMNVVATTEVMFLVDWENNFTITWEKNNIVMNQNDAFYFKPTIDINVDLSFNYSIHFMFTAYTNDTGNSFISSVGATAKFIIITENNGIKLGIRTTDQADFERASSIELYYGGDTPEGWSLQKTITESYFQTIMPAGWYWIIATELEHDIARSKIVEIREDSVITIVYDLVLFSLLEIRAPDNENSPMKVAYIIENKYSVLRNVYIQVILRNRGNIIGIHNLTLHRFDKGVYASNFTWSAPWESSEYVVDGQIYVNAKLYVNRTEIIALNFPFRITNPQIPNLDLIFMGFLILIAIFRVEIKNIMIKVKDKIKPKNDVKYLENDD